MIYLKRKLRHKRVSLNKIFLIFSTPKCVGKKSIYGHVPKLRSPQANGGRLWVKYQDSFGGPPYLLGGVSSSSLNLFANSTNRNS